MGLRGWRRTMTRPTTKKSSVTTMFPTPFTCQFWRVRA